AEAALVEGLRVFAPADLAGVMAHLAGTAEAPAIAGSAPSASVEPASEDDLAEVHGQEAARRALELSAAGGHHLLFSGPPGAGKPMLGRCLPAILAPLDVEE